MPGYHTGVRVLNTTVGLLHKKTVLVKRRHFYIKKSCFFYKLNGCILLFLCKKPAFLQKIKL